MQTQFHYTKRERPRLNFFRVFVMCSKLKATDGRDATAINAVAGATKTDETFQSGKLSPERRLEIEKWLEAWQIRIDATDDSRTLEAITTNAWWKLKQMILGHGHETLEQNMAQFGGLLKDADCTNALELKIDAFCGEQMEQKEIDQKQHNESLIRFLSSFQDMLRMYQFYMPFLPPSAYVSSFCFAIATLMPHAPVDWIAEQIVHLEKQMRTSQGLLEQVTWLDYFIEQWKSYLPHSIAASKQHCIPKKLIHWAVETTARSYQDTLQKLRAPTMQEVETMVRFARF